MEEKNCCFEGKKATCFIANLVLSLICLGGCISCNNDIDCMLL